MSYKGKDVRNVFHLRTPEDANNIAKLSNNKTAVIVGTSFVGEKHLNTRAACYPHTDHPTTSTELLLLLLLLLLAGMEVAAALTDKAHSVSVIGIESVPFKQALGEKVGKAIMKVETGKSIALVFVGIPRAFSSGLCLFAAF